MTKWPTRGNRLNRAIPRFCLTTGKPSKTSLQVRATTTTTRQESPSGSHPFESQHSEPFTFPAVIVPAQTRLAANLTADTRLANITLADRDRQIAADCYSIRTAMQYYYFIQYILKVLFAHPRLRDVGEDAF